MDNFFNLDFPVNKLPQVGPSFSHKLLNLGIVTARDLLNHYPTRFLDYSHASRIYNLRIGEIVVVKGHISGLKNEYTKSGRSIQKGTIVDDTGKIEVIWFNQNFLCRTLKEGTLINAAGKIEFWGRIKALINPDYEIIYENRKTLHTTGLVPIYHETNGISSKWLRNRIAQLLKIATNRIEESLPSTIIEKYQLLGINESYNQIHFPDSESKANQARERLAFEELFLLQLTNLQRRNRWQQLQSYPMKIYDAEIKKLINSLPYKLTTAQNRSIQEILNDLSQPQPMNRMLEGDVGSGKTIVATIILYNAFLNGLQTAFMAPTEILAQQHFVTLKQLLNNKMTIGLFTKNIKHKNKPDLLVGTHALIHKQAEFTKLGLVIIDEQHRFGVAQRAQLLSKGQQPHLLTMTATPIPRTIALTIFGDLSLSVIDEMPIGRKIIKTWVVPQEKRLAGYNWIKEQIKKGGQVFIVCPLIDNSESLVSVKSVKEEYLRLKQTIFTQEKLGLLHGRLKPKEKEQVLNDFREHNLDILVSTPVIEVGVDIPNATVLVVESAERFGLAQLHQLRGRVGRSDQQAYCLLYTEVNNEKSQKRLKALEKYHEGNKLAALDFQLRGPGEMYGTAQHGFPELKIARYDNLKLISLTLEAANIIFKQIADFPHLQETIKQDKIDRSKLN